MLAEVWKELFAEEEGCDEKAQVQHLSGGKTTYTLYFSTLSPNGELILHQCLFDIYRAQNFFKLMFGFYIKQ